MLDCLPAVHISTNPGDDFECRVGIYAVDAGKIGPRHLLQCFFNAARRLIASVTAVRRIEAFELRQYLLVAICNLLQVELVEFNCLLQAEQMFCAVIAVKGTGNGFFGVLATFIP